MTAERPLAAVIAEATDRGALGATAPALLLEVQAQLGLLAALAAQVTERGRRPFRPDDAWTAALGRLSFSVYNLADQTGVDVDAATRELAQRVIAASAGPHTRDEGASPVPEA